MNSLLIPAAHLGDADDQAPADALLIGSEGFIRLSGPSAWTRPIFDGATARGRRAVNRNSAVKDENVRWNSVPSWPAKIPWRTDWKPGAGTDNACIIRDPQNGVVWEAQNLRYERPWDTLYSSLVADQLHMRTPDCEINETHFARGCGGVPAEAGVLTAAMARDGINTALAFFCANIQYGPGARIVLPAKRLEHQLATDRPGLVPGDVPQNVPHGSRFYWTWDDDQLDQFAWQNSKLTPGTTTIIAKRRETLLKIYVAMRVYGWVTLATCTGTDYIETEGLNNKESAVIWKSLGFSTDADFRKPFTGMVVRDQIRVVRPA